MKREFALVGCSTTGVACDGDTIYFHVSGATEVRWIEVFLNDELINVLPVVPMMPVCCGDILKVKLPPDGLMWLNGWKGNPEMQ